MNEESSQTGTKREKAEDGTPLLGVWSKGRLRRRLMIGHIIIFLVAIVMTMVVLAIQLRMDYVQEESDRMRALAGIVSDNIPSNIHEQLAGKILEYHDAKGERKQEIKKELVESEGFEAVRQKLLAIKSSSRRIARVFTMVQVEYGLALVVVCDNPDDVGLPCDFRNVKGMANGFQQSSSGEDSPSPTWEKLGMSGYAPVKTGDAGHPALVGVSRESTTIWDMVVTLGWLWLLPLGAGLLLSFLMALRLAGIIMKPLQRTAKVIKRLSEGDMSAYISPHDQQVTRVLRRSVMDLGASLGKRERIHAYYGRTLSPALMESVMKAGEEKLTRIDERDVSLVRVKINVGAIADPSKDPNAYFEVINAASKVVIDAILDNGGSIEEINGTMVLGVFGSPLAMEEHVQAAVRAAADVRKDLADLLPRRRRENLPEFGMTIWVHTGKVLAGIVGTPERGEFRVIGEPVGIIKSLERPKETEGAGPVATEAVVQAGLPNGFGSRPVGESSTPAGAIKLYQIHPGK